jgi:hypothetical protein
MLKAVVVAGAGAGKYSLQVGADSVALVRGIVCSTALSQAATAAGAKRATVSTAVRKELDAFVAGISGLAGQLDTTVAYRPPARGTWLASVDLAAAAAEPIVLLVESPPRKGRWSLVQLTAAGAVTGGLTLVGL